MKLVIKKSTAKGKKYTATFVSQETGKTKVVHFGSDVSQTYVEGASKEKRRAYLARHAVNSRLDNTPTSPHSLSLHLLWGESTSLAENLKAFKRKFSLL